MTRSALDRATGRTPGPAPASTTGLVVPSTLVAAALLLLVVALLRPGRSLRAALAWSLGAVLAGTVPRRRRHPDADRR